MILTEGDFTNISLVDLKKFSYPKHIQTKSYNNLGYHSVSINFTCLVAFLDDFFS